MSLSIPSASSLSNAAPNSQPLSLLEEKCPILLETFGELLHDHPNGYVVAQAHYVKKFSRYYSAKALRAAIESTNQFQDLITTNNFEKIEYFVIKNDPSSRAEYIKKSFITIVKRHEQDAFIDQYIASYSAESTEETRQAVYSELCTRNQLADAIEWLQHFHADQFAIDALQQHSLGNDIIRQEKTRLLTAKVLGVASTIFSFVVPATLGAITSYLLALDPIQPFPPVDPMYPFSCIQPDQELQNFHALYDVATFAAIIGQIVAPSHSIAKVCYDFLVVGKSADIALRNTSLFGGRCFSPIFNSLQGTVVLVGGLTVSTMSRISGLNLCSTMGKITDVGVRLFERFFG